MTSHKNTLLLALLSFLLIAVSCSKDEDTATLTDVSEEKAVSKAPEFTRPEGDKPYAYVENMPQFRGGDAELLKYLGNNMKYPKAAEAAGEEGMVVLGFVVETDGSLSNIEVVRSAGEALDAEAIRTVKSMDGMWIPGQQNGESVRVQFNLPVRFSLNHDKK
ncbi:energy transducer TonB [Pontibacter harenae]|uniref:energy transducer TonB n=1 Tax=Pontibacter harenae TaxID=2894083 RepID=UPI001E4BDEA6|nr:energy transducer TonB [Pontibacter harenae]MCC9166188.1 energy transducer TonB [Pontibacter harenae]